MYGHSFLHFQPKAAKKGTKPQKPLAKTPSVNLENAGGRTADEETVDQPSNV
jgi:hypothetical protein